MVSKWVITPIYPIYRQVITHLLAIDPNFLGHLSRLLQAPKHPQSLHLWRYLQELCKIMPSGASGLNDKPEPLTDLGVSSNFLRLSSEFRKYGFKYIM